MEFVPIVKRGLKVCKFMSGFYDTKTGKALLVPGIDSHSQIAHILAIAEDDDRYVRWEFVPPAKWKEGEARDSFVFSWDDPTKAHPTNETGRQAILDAKTARMPNEASTKDWFLAGSEAVQLEAVKQNGSAVHYIKNPSVAVQLAAVKHNG